MLWVVNLLILCQFRKQFVCETVRNVSDLKIAVEKILSETIGRGFLLQLQRNPSLHYRFHFGTEFLRNESTQKFQLLDQVLLTVAYAFGKQRCRAV